SPTDESDQEGGPGKGLAAEKADQTDPTARNGQSDGENAGTDASANPLQQTQAETQGDKQSHSSRQEKKAAKNAKKDHLAEAAPQQQTTGDNPANLAVDLKPATAEPTAHVAGPQVDTADGSVKPAANTAESQSNGSMRPDSGRPGRTALAARAPTDTTGPEGSDQARFVGRVARAFEAMGHRNGPIRLKLSPAELGSLRIEISVRGGVMTAQVEAETSTARNLLLDNLPALRDRLAQQGIKIEQFDVDLSDQSPGGLPDQRPDHADSDGQGGQRKPTPQASREEIDREANSRPAGRITRPGENSQLNVIV
ncbi:MAG TPA: flagellar hook-length control protein FliK, partial [Thermoguttaceae bacterium]|nr:flagellar hook-length control protein FliK [Thermoguttaceae bacterium]